jgi:FtsH-binding integral membrane protein
VFAGKGSWGEHMDLNGVVIAIVLISCLWITFSTVRRYKIAKLQAELQSKLLEKISTGQELLAYAQTDAGRQLLESLKVERIAPHGKIIIALQVGIVLFVFGGGMLVARNFIPDATEPFTIVGSLICALGLGFALSSLASYFLAKSFGLLNGALK